MTPTITSGTVAVPGATIYYEAQGSGPLLLLIPGGPADAGVFTDLAAALADRYTAVAYDPRGNSRSILTGPPTDQDLDVHGDDAAALIQALGDSPAFVFGNSGGAQIGLNLAARHPALVRVLVAHEPPCIELLPTAEADEALAADLAIHETYQRDGVEAAMAQFMAMAGMTDDEFNANHGAPDAGEDTGPDAPVDHSMGEMPPELLATFGRIEGNMEYFFAHGIMPLSRYQPDVAALRTGSPRVVVGIGAETTGDIAHRTGLALAAALGTAPVTFPGDHGGFGPHAAAFAAVLDPILRGE